MGKPDDLTFRLPKDIKPQHYDIYLYPKLNDGTFEGKVSILINVLKERSYIALHKKGLSITSTKLNIVDKQKNTEVDVADTCDVDEHEMVIVSTKKQMAPGLYKLNLEFNGSLENKIVGFYSSKYKDDKNETRYIATTKFEPTYARQAFPCFDEPNFKAEYTVHLVQPKGDGYKALSNMTVEKVEENKPSAGLSTVSFAKSVPMSTYLAAFIVSDFVAITANAKGLKGKTFPVSVYTTRAQKDKGKFPLEIGVKVIEYYINLFSIDYPLPKMDMVAIPDFVSGAMENWGLVTFREARFLHDPKTSSTTNKFGTATVIAHEFAHMWFGNLVTMTWWNDLWLNEGFATYISYRCLNAILPEWKMMSQFLIQECHSAFNLDDKLSSHPIVQTVSNPDEITSIFDIISYKKGSTILRMLDNFLGSDVFDAGISSYLKKFAYKNAETSDLFASLQESVGNKINVVAIMDTWTRQMGFPVVDVARNKNTFTLTQKRFLVNPDAKYDTAESDYGYKWTIPITYITNTNLNPTLVWFDKDAKNLTIKLCEPIQWIKFNSEQIGFYRVNYDDSEWQALNDVLRWNHKKLATSDRTSLLSDAFSLAQASQLDYSIAMGLTTYLPKEQNNVPWSVAKSELQKIDRLLLSTNVSTKFRNYVKHLVEPSYRDVTWKVENDESIVRLKLRVAVLALACSVGHTECLDEVGAMFKSWINDPEDKRPHPDIRFLVYHYGMHHVGTEEEWDKLFQKFIKETDAAEKNKLMYGLSGIQDYDILQKLIKLSMDESYVRSQDALNCLALISENPIGTPIIWDWVRENWELLVKKYTLNDRYFGKLIQVFTKTFTEETRLDEMKAFFKKYPEAGAGKSERVLALETVSNNIKAVKKNAAKLEIWLDAHSKNT